MPAAASPLDDQPLTPAEIRQHSTPNQHLARKIAAHLGDGWEGTGATDGSLRGFLTGPAGETLSTYATPTRGTWKTVIRGVHPPDLPEHPDHPAGFHRHSIDLPLETPPSQVAARITTDLLPAYRAHLSEARGHSARIDTDNARLKERADVLAARLGPGWDVKAHPDLLADEPRSYFTVARAFQQKQIFGTFTVRHGTQTTQANLCNLTTDPLDTIVEAVVHHQRTDEYRWRRWPKHIRTALLLMHEAGYSIDRIGPVHTHLFGKHLFKMDSHVGRGSSVVDYLRERPDAVEQVIRMLSPGQKGPSS